MIQGFAEIDLGGDVILLGEPHLFIGVPRKLRDPFGADMAIRRAAADHGAMGAMRDFIAREGHGSAVANVSDPEIIRILEGRLQSGRIEAILLHRPSRGGEGVAARPPASPSAASVKPAAPAAGAARPVKQWSAEERIGAVIRKAAAKVPADLGQALRQLLSPESLAFMAGFAAVSVAANMTPYGWIADAVIAGLAFAFGGLAALRALRDLADCFYETAKASSEQDLDRAAEALARAVVAIGVAGLMAILHRVASRYAAKTKPGPAEGEADLPPPKTPLAAPASQAASFLKPKLPKAQLEPGATPGPVSPTLNAMPQVPAGFPAISADEVNTFASTPTAETLPAGTKLYRIIGDSNNPSGAFWTRDMPATEADWRSAAAVKGEWNGDGGYVESTVPAGGLPAWTGQAAPQPAALPGYILPGGGDQVVVPPGSLKPSAPMPTPWSGP